MKEEKYLQYCLRGSERELQAVRRFHVEFDGPLGVKASPVHFKMHGLGGRVLSIDGDLFDAEK